MDPRERIVAAFGELMGEEHIHPTSARYIEGVRHLRRVLRSERERRGGELAYLPERDRGPREEALNSFLIATELEGKASLMFDLEAAQQEERTRIDALLRAEKTRWEQQYSQNLAANDHLLRRAQARYGGATAEELAEAAAVPVFDGSELEYDALAQELVRRGMADERKLLAAAGLKGHVREPWLRGALAQQLARDLKLLQPAGDGFTVADAKGNTATVGYRDVLDFLEVSDEEQ